MSLHEIKFWGVMGPAFFTAAGLAAYLCGLNGLTLHQAFAAAGVSGVAAASAANAIWAIFTIQAYRRLTDR